MRRISDYLDQKAARIPQLGKTDPMPYATANELSEQLDVQSVENICRSITALRKYGKVRVFPKRDPKRRNRRYGSISLPEVTLEEVYSNMKAQAQASLLAPLIKSWPIIR